jgi:hypothetical protein
VAAGGRDGARAEELLRKAREAGSRAIAEACKSAVWRMLRDPNLARQQRSLFNPDEKARFIAAIADTGATANLLGRARVRERVAGEFSEAGAWAAFAGEELKPMPPQTAVEYFRSKVPTVGDGKKFTQEQQRRAFTVAGITEQSLLTKIQRIIADALEGGDTTQATAARVQAVLDQAGVGQSNRGYAEMVVRTNMMSALNEGQTQEMQSDDLRDYFPAWRYDGIDDHRAGDDHRPNFGKYYPNAVPFDKVRGRRVYNCRCVPTPVDVETWKELKAGGARIARGYEQFMPKPPAKAAPKPKPKKPVQTLPLNLQPLANAADPAVTEKDIDAAIRHMRTLPREELKKVAKALGVDPSQGGITMRDQIIDKVEATREAVRETKAQAVIARLPIPVKADPNTSARFRLEAAEAVETVPAHVLAEAGQTGKSVHMGKKVTEVVPHLKGVTPRGWAPGSTWDEADGLYNNSVGEVIVTEETTHGKSHRTAGVVRHELGHAVDEAWGETKGEPSGLYCNSPEFQAAYEADMKEAAAGPDAPSLAYYLQPGAAGRSEAFAETFASVHGGGGSSPKMIASNFPRVKALIEAEIESRRPK